MELEKINSDDQPKQLTVSDYSSVERKKWVMEQYLAGRYPYDIFKEYEQTYQLSKASYDKDVLWSNTEIKKYGERSAEYIIEQQSNYLLDLYRHCRSIGDNSNAIKALKERRELLGIGGTKLKTAVQINQTVNHNNLPKFSAEEIRSMLGRTTPDTEVIDITPAE